MSVDLKSAIAGALGGLVLGLLLGYVLKPGPSRYQSCVYDLMKAGQALEPAQIQCKKMFPATADW
jgi:hypothetical protein